MYSLPCNKGRRKEVSYYIPRRERTPVTPVPPIRQRRKTQTQKKNQDEESEWGDIRKESDEDDEEPDGKEAAHASETGDPDAPKGEECVPIDCESAEGLEAPPETPAFGTLVPKTSRTI